MSSDNNTPLVSVFMPTYNQEQFISESIESVINQTYKNWELIIGDDSSTDTTHIIAKEYEKSHAGKIKVLQNSKNLGITKNSNKTLKYCQGKYVAFTAGDDIFMPKKIERQVALMEKESTCDISYHDVEVFDTSTGNILKYWNSGKFGVNPEVGNARGIAEKMIANQTSCMAGMSIMMRNEIIPREGYDERIQVASDWLFIIEACINSLGNIHFINETLSRYRKSDNSISNNDSSYLDDVFISLALIEYRYPFLINHVQKRRSLLYFQRAKIALKTGDHQKARALIKSSIKLSPTTFRNYSWWIKKYIKLIKK